MSRSMIARPGRQVLKQIDPPAGAVSLHRCAPHRALRGLVAGIVEFDQTSPELVVRRQPAGAVALLVVGLDAPLAVSRAARPAQRYVSFVAGSSTTAVTTQFTGRHHCMQIYLTPIGVTRLLGVPGRDLVDTVTDAADLLPVLGGPGAGELADRLASADGAGRARIVEAELLRRLGRTPPVDELSSFVWQRIVGSGGQVRIADVVAQTGYSHRHVTRRFAERIGLVPKAMASLVQFERAMHELGHASIAEVAERHGYADQSHLTRAVQRYAGESPAALARARRPTAFTALGVAPAGPFPAVVTP